LIVAKDSWSGAGGELIAGAVALATAIAGYGARWWQSRTKEQKEQRDHRKEVRAAARGVEGAFERAAAALRVASDSGGSLDGWVEDDKSLEAHVDRIRREADSDLWREIDGILRRQDSRLGA